jgi:hypothetical protein
MVKNKFIVIIVFLSFLGCSFESGSKVDPFNPEKRLDLSWEINSPQLIEQINLYYESVGKGDDEKVLGIYCKNEDSISTYYLNFFLGFYSLYHTPIQMIVEMDGKMVGISFAGMGDFNLSLKSYINILEKKYPESFSYYNEMKRLVETDTTYSYSENDLFPPPNTGGYETWILTFKEGKMIDKKIER